MIYRYYHGFERTGLVDAFDELGEAPNIFGVVGDDERVGTRISGNRIVRGNQWPKDRQNLRSGLVLEVEHLRDQILAAAPLAIRGEGARPKLCIGFRQYHRRAISFNCGKALQTQSREQNVIGQSGSDRRV